MANTSRRKKHFVEGPVQLALLKRVVRYWLLSLFLVGSLTFLGWMFIYPGIGKLIGPDAVLSQVAPVFVMGIVASLLILPLALRDLVYFSNRFVGPIVRIRRAMAQLADGQAVAPIKLRKEDFWQDLANSFNRIAAECQPFASNSTVLRESELDVEEKYLDSSEGILAGNPSVHVMI